MLVKIASTDRTNHRELIKSFARLRKRTFHDLLGWSVTIAGDEEIDEFDESPNVLVLETIDNQQVLGGLRLMPMHQPNMINTTFSSMLPGTGDFASPTIWEVTRFCVDERYSSAKSPTGASAVSMRLSYQSLMTTRDMGGTHHIAIVEPRTLELIRLFGAKTEVLRRQTLENGSEIVSAIWPIDDAFVDRMRWTESRLCERLNEAVQ